MRLSFAQLPVLLPGETLYSWFARIHCRNQSSAISITTKILTEQPRATNLHDMPGRIDDIARNTGNLVDPSSLATEHTLLGYFLPFLYVDRANALIREVRSAAVPQLKYRLGIPGSGVSGKHPLKACALCMESDERMFGCSYWHIKHQYPGTYVCQVHGTPLLVCGARRTPAQWRTPVLPRLAGRHTLCVASIKNQEALTVLRKLATFSREAALLPPGSLNRDVMAHLYAARLTELGMFSSEHPLRGGEQLTTNLSAYYTDIRDLPDIDVINVLIANPGWLYRQIYRRISQAAHPLKHILFMALLWNSWTEFAQAAMRASHLSNSGWKPRQSTSKAAAEAEHGHFLHLVVTERISISAASRATGVSTNTGLRWAKIAGLRYKARPKFLSDDVQTRARDLLRRGAAKKEICSKIGISIVSLNRLISSEPNTRTTWIQSKERARRISTKKAIDKILKLNPNASVHEVRRLSGTGYEWLYRHDQKWLMNRLAKRSNCLTR